MSEGLDSRLAESNYARYLVGECQQAASETIIEAAERVRGMVMTATKQIADMGLLPELRVGISSHPEDGIARGSEIISAIAVIGDEPPNNRWVVLDGESLYVCGGILISWQYRDLRGPDWQYKHPARDEDWLKYGRAALTKLWGLVTDIRDIDDLI